MDRPPAPPADPQYRPDLPGGGPAGPRPAGPDPDALAGPVADGLAAFPPHLAGADRDRLAAAVRARRRDRLLDVVTRAIAARLAARPSTL